MKRNTFRFFCLFLCLIISLFSGCGQPEQPEYIPEQEPEIESEPEPEPVLVPVLESYVLTVIGSNPETYKVGDNLFLDDYGRISKIEKRYDSVAWEYNSDGTLAATFITDDEGTTGTEEWIYENKLPVSYYFDPNNGFTSLRDSTFEIIFDEEGKVSELIENRTYTDAEDGSKYTDALRHVYSYDGNGFVTSMEYYSNGKLDHTTYFTYDEYGNLTVFSNVGANGYGEYIRIELNYTLVDESEVSAIETDPFTYCLSFEFLLQGML